MKRYKHRWWMNCRLLGFNHKVARDDISYAGGYVCVSCWKDLA